MSLEAVLTQNWDKWKKSNFEDAFTQRNYPVHGKGGWQIKGDYKQFKKSRSEYFTTLAKQLVEENALKYFPQSEGEKFVLRFNNEWTIERNKEKKLSVEIVGGVIKFNSKHKVNYWLSNFYPTLILYHGVKGPYLFYCTETAYKGLRCHSPELISSIAKLTDPVLAKKMETDSDEKEESPEDKLQIMNKVSEFKYRTNPVLRELLVSTRPANLPLIEDTDNSFWGNGNGAIPGQNHLGVLLSELRDKL